MKSFRNPLAATSLVFCLALGMSATAQEDPAKLAELLAELASPEAEDWEHIESQIVDIWSRSGSRSMDMLLERGRDALDEENYLVALEHFTALTDHAPEFAEGWNMRATVFYLLDRFELSVADIGRTLALNPDHFGALNGLGIILEHMGEEKDALAAYRRVEALNPHMDNVRDAIERLERRVSGVDI